MKQRKFFTKLILLGLIVSIGFVGCKNYDDQIDDLKGQISEVQKTVNDLKAKVDAGSVITKVESTGNGIKITLSDGTTHNITNGATGATGATGAAGAPGSVVTIGSNGNWFIDGKDTGKPSVGAQGPAGPAGPQGPAGIYYIPNADGYWYKVENGVSTKTNDKWQLPGIITALWDGKSVTLYGVKDENGNVMDGIVLGLTDLRSIVLIPDFVTPEGFPVINFGPLTSACKTITPDLIAKYQLNPSNVDVKNINLDELIFNYNGPTTVTRSADINATVVPGSAEISTNGILSVKIVINGDKVELPTSSKLDQIQLSVPLKTGAKIVSDWANVYKKELKAQIDVFLQRNITGTPKLPQTAAGAKALTVKDIDGATATDAQVVTLAYGSTLDLVDYVTTNVDVEKYGLKYRFDLLDESGNVIVYNRGSNNTDQQQFIKINNAAKGTIEAKVFSDSQIAASQGRTPIVRVTMYNDQDPTCPVLFGFVKVLLADKPVVVPGGITVNFEKLPASSVVSCDAGYTHKLTVEDVNVKIYNGVGLSKDEFHGIYGTTVTGGADDANGKVDVIADNSETTTTYLLEWTITNAQIWAKLGTANSVVVTKTVKYISSIPTLYPDITVNFTHTFTRPAENAITDKKIVEYWYNASGVKDGTYVSVKHNIKVPAVGENVSTNALFKTDLLAVFKNDVFTGLNNAEFIFHSTQPDGFTVTADGKTLKHGIQDIAIINGTILELQKSAKAQELLNEGVERLIANIGVRATYCTSGVGATKTYGVKIDGANYFPVRFIRPISPVVATGTKFEDGLDALNPLNDLAIATLVNYKDWRDYTFNSTHNYYGYYGITSTSIDPTKILTNLGGGTSFVSIGNYPHLDVQVVGAGTVLRYTNNGAAVGSEFTLRVPVQIVYAWGTITTATIDIPVKKTIGGSGVKGK